MKKIISLVMTAIVIVSSIANVVCAVNYSDIRSTYVQTSDYAHYINYDDDDRLQNRANCYGFAIRLHYLDLPLYGGFVGQIPGEFYDRSGSGTTFSDLINGNYNLAAFSVYVKVMQDCETLGYSTSALTASTSTTYVPPSASAEPNKRLIALVGKSREVEDFHFLVQTANDTWVQKYGEDAATGNCLYHTSIALTNDNISQHVRCCIDGKTMGSTVIFFYIDAPGTTDRGHYYHASDSTQTLVRLYEGHGNSPNLYECAGNAFVSSETIQGVTSILKTGYINHLYDTDYFVFDVAETGYYPISIFTDTDFDIRMNFADVTNTSVNSAVSFGTTYLTSNTGQTSFGVQLTAGRRYCLKIYSTNQTKHEKDRSYVISISR